MRFKQAWQRLRFFVVGRMLPKRLVQFLMYLTQTKFLVAVVVVLWRDDKILLLRHSYRPRYPWGLLTGWVNAGETPEAAACREIFEETGLHIEHLKYFYSGVPHHRHLEIGYWAEVSEPTVSKSSKDGEIMESRWFGFTELPDRLLPSQYPLIEQAYRHHQHLEA
ncbi:MAG: hypothetical protein C7B44_08770 [Sulfobacillus thermosulfidooxidans]|uniref:Nudix hydrolase domain-containing protein n=1 Tax=Sulfobacillus thermotolerans TaxID=338644 RepID=A0ABN5GZX6_9FIRM|nr:hypothetical protein BXT84_04510 [Sulfobacillus thermotolerans]MCY0907354.1 NUDIX hydrolase [Sulfobacillus thermotolerans]PSR36484.1 MAG: hypothetical protein C7B44_08770 [Sulfobacillus thermosulfidooxidans]